MNIQQQGKEPCESTKIRTDESHYLNCNLFFLLSEKCPIHFHGGEGLPVRLQYEFDFTHLI